MDQALFSQTGFLDSQSWGAPSLCRAGSSILYWFPYTNVKWHFCQCIGAASWRGHNFFVFKYFFDRSFLKFREIDEVWFHHRKNATNAMRKICIGKYVLDTTRFYIHINPYFAYTRWQICDPPHILICTTWAGFWSWLRRRVYLCKRV